MPEALQVPPVHAVLQQKPFAQNWDAHWLEVLQACPSGCRATHIPIEMSQKLPTAQLESLTHVVRQAPAEQVSGAHACMVPASQEPVPLQVLALRAEAAPTTQEAAAQTVPDAYFWHAPEPLQTPVVPHVDAGCSAHSARGSAPAATFPHVPFAPLPVAIEHAWHVPSHVVSQQTPSAQNPDAHRVASVPHVSPDDNLHTPPAVQE
ncbi:MAG: hypothetical protein A3G27_14495 [Betaproteobacteria bacterium RIFCSPLOWO2_12_FULL_66_14]|nr:MAG: hypothetical protein A3G27_14495 [Betaproteobacteria bacterium RIFCSPLOWO2_12_FULL_66_14]